MHSVDLRSDTITRPTKEMREAMASAEVGDDVMQEDPTVNLLETKAAALTGKEAALFVASGTMGNLVSLLSHCQRGDEVILGRHSHIHLHEQGGIAALASLHSRTVANLEDGSLSLNDIEKSINSEDIHHSRTKLVCIENTWYGRVLSINYMKDLQKLCIENDLDIHLDGARLFNAAVALGIEASEICKYVDSVQFCLSKSLASPVGSIVCGTKIFIEKARRARKMLGGGMRQAGVLASCGLLSLSNKMIARLEEDHRRAKFLAEGLAQIEGIKVIYVETNMVIFGSSLNKLTNKEFCKLLNDNGLLVFEVDHGIRAVTHIDLNDDSIIKAISIVKSTIENFSKGTSPSFCRQIN